MSPEESSNPSNLANFCPVPNVASGKSNAIALNPALLVAHEDHLKNVILLQKVAITLLYNNLTSYANFAQKTCD